MTLSEPIISVSGLRGIIGESLIPPVAERYAAAFAAEISPGPIVVGRDGRTTGPMLANALFAALTAVGRDVIYADVAATPTVGVLVRQHHAAGGIQISASHNPPPYNGLKLFGPDGRVISAGPGERVLQRYRTNESHWTSFDKVGRVHVCDDTTSEHLRLVLDTVDVGRIRSMQFNVLLDSNHGAGSVLGRKLLDELGCNVTCLGEEANGIFAHTPEPTAENLRDVGTKIVSAGAAVGFCQDPDADRLALIDENGRYVGEEFTLAIVLNHVLATRKGAVVTNCSTSRMSQDLAEKYGVPFFHSKVGEANVCDTMMAQSAVYGGEGNGGPIDPQVGYVRDSFVGMAQVLDAMAATNKSISELAADLPQYAIHKDKVSVEGKDLPTLLAKLEQHFADASANHQDGLRLDWPGKWLLVRASNTEPIVRFIAEAPTIAEAEQLCQDAAKVVA
ncbi:MAG: phosphoglucosamine mutase [Planctomycetales bacterium]|nr:phosphoglucosamine mutase [Planctomycetales bacterium]